MAIDGVLGVRNFLMTAYDSNGTDILVTKQDSPGASDDQIRI